MRATDKKNIKNNRAFTLIEIVVSISILLFGIISVYSVFFMTVIATQNISSRFVAAYLAQEGLEIISNLRDNNLLNKATWDVGLISAPCGSSTGCMADYTTESPSQLSAYDGTALGIDGNGFYSYATGATPTIFKRKITITNVLSDADIINVDVLVTWTYKGQVLSFDSNEYLYSW